MVACEILEKPPNLHRPYFAFSHSVTSWILITECYSTNMTSRNAHVFGLSDSRKRSTGAPLGCKTQEKQHGTI
jgi:hypothetical protein